MSPYDTACHFELNPPPEANTMNESRVGTLADVLSLVEQVGPAGTRRRDLISAVKRLCEMAGAVPASVTAQPPAIREMIGRLRPAAYGVSPKSYSNLKSLLTAALELAGVVDSLGRGSARQDPQWGPLLQAINNDQRLSNGLAAFANWCARQGILPGEVDDAVVQRFLVWLESRTLHPKPRDLVRGVPRFWNEASKKINLWPSTTLTMLSFKSPAKHLSWPDLDTRFREDVDAYLECRANPDLFDERPEAPKRPLAPTTIRQQREHLRLAASIMVQNGEIIASLAELVRPERFKKILRYYHDRANGEPNAFVIGVAKTLIQVAQYHAGRTSTEVSELKRLASKLPAVPFDLTSKNKMLLRQLESERLRAKLYFLPEQLLAEVAKDLEKGRIRFVKAQVAIAIDILLALPLRPQNLSALSWQHNFNEPNGPRGPLVVYVAARDTKSKRKDIVGELPEEVARHLRWYRRNVLPRLGADVNGPLFVTEKGTRKHQETLTVQIIDAIVRHIGIYMTPHQFRHFGAASYLEDHPEDFETPRALLGHAWGKTTRIYAGSSSRRASRAYNRYLLKQREDLKLLRSRRKPRG
jgi:integrase